MSNKVTITVDLDEVKELARSIAKDNSGLETSSGFTPSDLDRAVSDVLVKGPATKELRDLLMKIVTIHYDAHDEFTD